MADIHTEGTQVDLLPTVEWVCGYKVSTQPPSYQHSDIWEQAPTSTIWCQAFFPLRTWSCTSHFVALTAQYHIKGRSFFTETMDYLMLDHKCGECNAIWYACVGEFNGCNQVHCRPVRGCTKYILEFSKQLLCVLSLHSYYSAVGFMWNSTC